MGFGDIGCYNSDSRIPTPNIDALASRGARWTDMHTASAVCTPSRYGLLTGSYCWRGNLPYGVLYGYEPPLIVEDTRTLGTGLQQAGYRTACVGKWHLGMDFRAKAGEQVDFGAPLPWRGEDVELEQKIDLSAPVTSGPIERGFDSFFGTAGCATAQPPYAFIDGEQFVEQPTEFRDRIHFTGRPGMTAPSWDHAEVDPIFTERAVDEISRLAAGKSPFFLYLAASAPHEPCLEETVPEFARGRSQAGSRGDLVWLFDWMVGRVVSALEREGVAENTVVIVSSDNGALPGDRINRLDTLEGYELYDHKSCGDWRGYKAHIWEGGHRVPFVVGPAATAADKEITEPVVETTMACLTDLYETLFSIGGVPTDGVVRDSIDLSEHAGFSEWTSSDGGGATNTRKRRALIHHSGNGVYSARVENWKLIFESEGSGGWPPPRGSRPEPGSPGQLYDLYADPGETRNLYGERAPLVQELEELLTEIRGGATR
jgi:arylsulfatase A-like enzyme